VSIEKPGNNSKPSENNKETPRRRLIKESPFARLAQRTQDLGEEALKDARLIDIERVKPNPNQPRRFFSEKGLQELSADIRIRGILQPPIVRTIEDGYEIVVGERRYRASLLAGLKQIPVLIQNLSDEDAKIISLVENIQREDLTFEDEARYYEILQKEYKYSLRQIAELVNKSKSYVDSRLTLLKHPALLASVQNEKLGLHEATLLARMGISYDESGEKAEDTVREKDNASDAVREKDDYSSFKLAQPFRRLVDLIKNTRKKIEKASEEEKKAILESISELERELQVIKDRIGFR